MPMCVIYQINSLLIYIVAAAIACFEQHSQQPQCQQISWGPPVSSLDPQFFVFSTKEECQAAMCVARCGQSPPPKNSELKCLFVNATGKINSNSSDARQNATGGTRPPSEIFAELRDAMNSLGPDAGVIRDKNGFIIGAEVVFSNRALDDFSYCCTTREAYFFNRTLVDYFGKNQTLAHINELGSYQLIRHGFCGNKGACSGQCDQIYSAIPLIIVPFHDQAIRFSLFQIPTYCTCRVSSRLGV